MKKNTRKKIEKVIIISLLAIILSIAMWMMYNHSVNASEIDPEKYRPYDRGKFGEVEGADKLLKVGNYIIGFLQIVGSIVLVVVLAVIGIKYMIGSAEEKAEYKKSMQPYLVGAVMVFAITSILKLIAYFAQNVIYVTT